MTAKVLNVFANLETEFLAAKQSLKDVDESIKRVTGREPNVANNKDRPIGKPVNARQRVTGPFGGPNNAPIDDHSEEPQRKRRFYGNTPNRIRYDERESEDADQPVRKPTLQSSVIATTREVKPRTQALEEQKSDTKSLARNRRMFGMILGTLQKFQKEETSRKDTQTQKRVEIEKKLDAKAEEERVALKKEKRELFLKRREKQAQIRRIEHKMLRVEIHQEWERSHQHLSNFIQTKTKPHIFYLPAKHNPQTEKRLQETKDKYRLIVAEKRAKVQKELSEIDDLYKKEEQNEIIEEELDENEPQDTSGTQMDESIEKKSEDLTKDEMNSESNDRLVSGDVEMKSEEQDSEQTSVGVKPEDTSNESNGVTPMAGQEAIGDKEFEPIYDE